MDLPGSKSLDTAAELTADLGSQELSPKKAKHTDTEEWDMCTPHSQASSPWTEDAIAAFYMNTPMEPEATPQQTYVQLFVHVRDEDIIQAMEDSEPQVVLDGGNGPTDLDEEETDKYEDYDIEGSSQWGKREQEGSVRWEFLHFFDSR